MMMRSFSWVSVKTKKSSVSRLLLLQSIQVLKHEMCKSILDPMNREPATAVLVDYCAPQSYSKEKFECLGGFLGAFSSDFRHKFTKMLFC